MRRPLLALAALSALALPACLRSGLPLLGEVPAFELTAEDGRAFRDSDLRGKIWVADFIYTTCRGPCPRMTAQLKQIGEQTRTLSDVALVSFTVDPETDTPAVLKAYAEQHRYQSGRWHFLTGPVAALQRLSSDTFRLGDSGSTLEHSTRFVLIDGKMRIRGYYDTTDSGALAQIVEDIGKLRREVL